MSVKAKQLDLYQIFSHSLSVAEVTLLLAVSADKLAVNLEEGIYVGGRLSASLYIFSPHFCLYLCIYSSYVRYIRIMQYIIRAK